MRRLLLFFSIVAAVFTSLIWQPAMIRAQQQTPGSPAETRARALNEIFDRYWEAYLERWPEFASEIGDKRYNSRLADQSATARDAWLAQERGFAGQLNAIDPAGLSDEEQTSRAMLLRSLAMDQEAAQFKEWEMPVDQMHGIYEEFPGLATHLVFNSAKDYDDWIARLQAIPRAFDQVTVNMRAGMHDRRVPPKYLLEQALVQVRSLADQRPEDSPLAAPLKKFPSGMPEAEQDRIRSETLAAIASYALPAYQRFSRFLEQTYIPKGRAAPGIWAIPGGDRYYQFLIRQETTLNETPEQIHAIGLKEVARDEAEMLKIANKLGFGDLRSFRASLKNNPRLKPASPEALQAAYQGHVNDMEAKLHDLFGKLPRSRLEVVRMPEYLEKTAPPAYYDPGSPETGRPAHLWVNLYNVPERSLLNVESISYHEGVPGHHLQLSLAQEQVGVPQFRKHAEYTAFVEGWALYGERLGKDAGFYQDPYSDYGRVDADMWRAIRLVVDTGVHSEHWTRRQMVDYFHAHSSLDEPTVQSEVDRYIAWPAQALAYKSGQMEILELRERAKKELGNKFDIRAFHDEVVDTGAMPLDMLDARIAAWIANQK